MQRILSIGIVLFGFWGILRYESKLLAAYIFGIRLEKHYMACGGDSGYSKYVYPKYGLSSIRIEIGSVSYKSYTSFLNKAIK